MRLSRWSSRVFVVVACVAVAPRVAGARPPRPPGRQFGAVAARGEPAPTSGERTPAPAKAAASAPTITVVGDRLVIQGDDPKAVAMVYELARMLANDKNQSYKAFRLNYADAAEVARVIEEWFNGPPKASTAPAIPSAIAAALQRGGRAGRPTLPPPEPPKPPRVHVVADPATNSVIVRADALDLITVEHLIASAIDVDPSESGATMKPFVIGPLKNAVATEVVRLLKDVYLESTDQTRGRSGRGRPRPQPLDPTGRPKAVTLSIAADDRTNTIIGMGSESMADGIRKVVAVIEEKSKDDTKSVELVPTQGIDPALLEQVVNAIQARPMAPQPGQRPGVPTAPGRGSPFSTGR